MFLAHRNSLEEAQHSGEPALAKALPTSAVAAETTREFSLLFLSNRVRAKIELTLNSHSPEILLAENTNSGYEVADKAPEPAATESAPVAETAAPASTETPVTPSPATNEKAAATPAPAAASQPKKQQKKKGGLFSCCGKPENYDS